MMSKLSKSVTIIIPSYNEEASLPHLYDALKELMNSMPMYDWEVLFINDGSIDKTLSMIVALYKSDNRISYVDLSRNFGKEKAMLAGFDYCKGDCAVIIDADLQDPPCLIKDMLKYWEKGYEDVYAKRRNRGKEPWLRRKLSMMFYNMLDRSTRFEVLKNVGDFRLLDRKCIEALRQLRESERYTKGLFCWIGYKKKEILFDRDDRIYGETHWNFWQLVGLAIEGFTSFTTIPLRIATVIGSLTALGAIIYLIWTLIKVALWGDPVAGFPTLISVVLFIGAVQLIAIGILGEYIGRIFNESKNRPVYLVETYKSRNIDDKASK
ncbi:glycosyltransferase family 2 protein [Hallella colorans]|uniref:glycosyltransferase family 2 protein n=1 Tax=Hallella colorans TaxID=1703337 RepID=UPI002889317E|nr:glycosyltransferase family 2 protein [Hallella colorans]